jgi:hypothetical protein
MVARTPLGIPYVEPADTVRTYPTTSHELATKLQALTETGARVAVTPGAAWTGGEISVRKMPGFLLISVRQITTSNALPNTWYDIATLPGTHRPSVSSPLANTGYINGFSCFFTVEPSGVIKLNTGGKHVAGAATISAQLVVPL